MKKAGWMGLLGVLLTTAVLAGGRPGDYLGKDGELKAALEIRDVQGGFAGFTGWNWTINEEGSWVVERVVGKKNTVQAKGKLSKEQLASLAKELAQYDLLGLKNSGRTVANPHVVTVKFGKHQATLTLLAGDPLPKADAKSVPGRYSGIVGAVKELVDKKERP